MEVTNLNDVQVGWGLSPGGVSAWSACGVLCGVVRPLACRVAAGLQRGIAGLLKGYGTLNRRDLNGYSLSGRVPAGFWNNPAITPPPYKWKPFPPLEKYSSL